MKRYFAAAKWIGLFFLTALIPLPAQVAPELQEQGVLYFDNNLPAKITGTIHTVTTLYLHRDFQTALASLYPGQKIEFVGMSPEGYLLKSTARNNTVMGWIHPEDLPTGVDQSLFTQAQKIQVRRDAVAVAITNKSVIQGMTPDEVKAAVGAPEQVLSKVDPSGSSLTWIYTTYREDPQYEYALNTFGRPILQTYYVKIPVGRLTIAFVNGSVISIEQHKIDPNSPGIVTN